MSANDTQVGLGGQVVPEAEISDEDGEQSNESQETIIDPEEVEPEVRRTDSAEEDGSGEQRDGDNSEEDSLSAFGVDEDHRPESTALDQPDGEMREDRRTNLRRGEDDGEQSQLFPDVKEDQMTLTGDNASKQCLF